MVEVFIQIGIIHRISEILKMKEFELMTTSIWKKKPFFCNTYDTIGAYHQKRINFDRPL